MNADASISERGASRVPWPWVLPIGIYLVGLAGLALYAIVALWPDAGAPGAEAPGPTFLIWPFTRGSEQATLLLVFFAGVLGALVHALRSFYWYVGHRKLIVSWVAMYFLLPLVGGALGFLFYLVFRGGLLQGTATGDVNSIGFAAVSGLVGMFSEQAIRKLKDVAETLFAKTKPGMDSITKDEGGKTAQ
ncbi:MAG: hypothetical protein WCQ45_05320 [bacterium]